MTPAAANPNTNVSHGISGEEPSAKVPHSPRAWYRRWQAIVPLSLLACVLGIVGLWFAVAELSEWAFDRFVAEKRAQGYALSVSDFLQRAADDWHARRAATPGVRCAAQRLCQFGARVAGLTLTAGPLEKVDKPWEEVDIGVPDLGASDAVSELAPELRTETFQSRLEVLYDVRKDGRAREMAASPSLRRTLLRTTSGRYLAAHWRQLLAMDYPPPPDTPGSELMNSGISQFRGVESPFVATRKLHELILVYLLAASIREGDADNAVALWEMMSRSPLVLDDRCLLEAHDLQDNLHLLGFAMRSGLLREEHLLRLLDSPFQQADDLRRTRVYITRWKIAEALEVAAEYRTYRLPVIYSPDPRLCLEFPQNMEFYMLQLLPLKMNLLFYRNELRHAEAYMRRIESQQGTAVLDAYQKNTREYERDRYIIDVLTIEPWNLMADAAMCNLRYAVLGFGLYKARTGKIPEKLEDFMTPELNARLIQVPYMHLVYAQDPDSGAYEISCEYDEDMPPQMTTREVSVYIQPKIVVHHPGDAPLRFPLEAAAP